ncbi:MAG: 2-amino-4-hydroxy-6-hydroxymethyldihydropteridine diphosphokinase [Phycisphaerae bacterium]
MSELVTAYVALGSNLGDRAALISRALELLGCGDVMRVVAVSTLHETAPVGGPDGQGKYLNGVARVETTLSPHELLRHCLSIERQLGRLREQRNGPRTIDLDILLYGAIVVDDAELTIPHPRMHEREFVMRPLGEVRERDCQKTNAGEDARGTPERAGSP